MPPCRICGSISIGRSSKYQSADWPMMYCVSCRASYVEADIDPELLRQFYRYKDYGSRVYSEWGLLKELRRRDYTQLLIHAEALLGKSGTLLDVGCSAGAFLTVAYERGWSVRGIEWDADTAASAPAVLRSQISVGDVSDLVRSMPSADVITFNHVLEHLADPVSILAAARLHLKPKGLILIRVPNADSLASRLMGSKWRWFSPPIHLCYFTPYSIRIVARRLGLQLIEMAERRGDGHTLPLELLASAGVAKLGGGVRCVGKTSDRHSILRGVSSTAERIFEVLDHIPIVSNLGLAVDNNEIVAWLSKLPEDERSTIPSPRGKNDA